MIQPRSWKPSGHRGYSTNYHNLPQGINLYAAQVLTHGGTGQITILLR